MTGHELRASREALGLTKVALASFLTVSRKTIERWEDGTVRIMHTGMLALAMEALAKRDPAELPHVGPRERDEHGRYLPVTSPSDANGAR